MNARQLQDPDRRPAPGRPYRLRTGQLCYVVVLPAPRATALRLLTIRVDAEGQPRSVALGWPGADRDEVLP